MVTTFVPVLVETLGKLTLVHVLGELDVSNCGELTNALEKSASRSDGPIIVAFVECTYVDTSGLTALVAAHRKHGNRIHVIVPPNSNVRRIFESSGLHRALQMHDDFRSAIAAASHPAQPALA
jgi:anti-anti-sigma factor